MRVGERERGFVSLECDELTDGAHALDRIVGWPIGMTKRAGTN